MTALFSKTATRDIASFGDDWKCDKINNFWPELNVSANEFVEEEYRTFFDFISTTLQDLHPHRGSFATDTFDGLFGILQRLRDNQQISRESVFQKIKDELQYAPDDSINRSIELTLRLWLGINVQSQALLIGPQNPRDTKVQWKGNETLKDMIAKAITQTKEKASSAYSIDSTFTAANLCRYRRINIRLTNNLKDHLKIEGERRNRSVSIYRHKTILINHWKCARTSPIATPVLEEAIRTLELLFPFGDEETEELMEQLHVPMWTSSEIQASSDLDSYKIWGANIASLMDLFYGPAEDPIGQLMDTRDIGQWLTLWVSIVGVFIITITFGALSTVYSIKQYNIAIKSYELSLAVACQQKTAPLPGFCD